MTANRVLRSDHALPVERPAGGFLPATALRIHDRILARWGFRNSNRISKHCAFDRELRNGQVFIRNSMHVPLNKEAVRDAMPAFFDLMRAEEHSAVRLALGHFIFVYIHPYMDGNGRMARFLMNTMMAAGGYPWTVIPLSERKVYMASLEKASVDEDIAPFAGFLAKLVRDQLPPVPTS